MCRVAAKVKGRNLVLQTIGYRGKREARSMIGDLRQARAFIVYKEDAKGLRIGSNVVVTVAGRRIKCKVKRWSRGSKLLLPVKDYPLKNVSTSRLRRVIVR